jgi:hypothetical protein
LRNDWFSNLVYRDAKINKKPREYGFSQKKRLRDALQAGGEKPLDKKALSVRVPEDIAQAVRALPDSQRSEWLRSVISEAVQRTAK